MRSFLKVYRINEISIIKSSKTEFAVRVLHSHSVQESIFEDPLVFYIILEFTANSVQFIIGK